MNISNLFKASFKNTQNKIATKSKAIIYQGELDFISKCVLDYPDIETGGDLFGFWTYSGHPVIQYVIGPGPNSNHQVAFFNQDLEYLIEYGNILRNSHSLQHIGEWHSHHRLGLAEPSSHDVTTVTRAITDYNLGKFFLVIANIRSKSSTLNGFMFRKEQGRSFDYSGWVINPGESPIRQGIDQRHPDLVYKPKTTLPSLQDLSISTLEETEFVKPEYQSGSWLQIKANHSLLNKLVEEMGREFEKVKVLQNDLDKSVYLEFSKGLQTFHLIFPNNFPYEKPQLQNTNQGEPIEVNEVLLPWSYTLENPTNTVDYVKAAIDSTYSYIKQ